MANLTESALPLFTISFWPPYAAATQPPQDDVNVREDNQGRWKDGTIMKGHDELISLELPHLVGNGLHLKECVAVDEKVKMKAVPELISSTHMFLLSAYLKTAMRRLTNRMLATSR